MPLLHPWNFLVRIYCHLQGESSSHAQCNTLTALRVRSSLTCQQVQLFLPFCKDITACYPQWGCSSLRYLQTGLIAEVGFSTLSAQVLLHAHHNNKFSLSLALSLWIVSFWPSPPLQSIIGAGLQILHKPYYLSRWFLPGLLFTMFTMWYPPSSQCDLKQCENMRVVYIRINKWGAHHKFVFRIV